MMRSCRRLSAVILFLCFLSGQAVHAALTAEHSLSIKTEFEQPTDTAVADNGDIYVLHGTRSQVAVFSAQGKLKNHFAGFGNGEGELLMPMAITIKAQQVYIADTGNARIAVFNLRGKFIRNIALKNKLSKTESVAPVSLLVMDKKIIWSDRKNHQLCVSKIDDGTTLRCWGEQGKADAQFEYPYQLALDEQAYIFAVDVLNARVQVFTLKGRHFMNVGRFGVHVRGGLFRPNGLAMSEQGYLLVSDVYLGSITVFKNGRDLGVLTTNDLTALVFEAPVSITLHKNRLYVTDAANDRVEIYQLRDTAQTENHKKEKAAVQASSARQNCVTCHISWADKFVPRDQEDVSGAPDAQQRMCYSCHHGVVIDSRKAIAEKYQHPDIHHRRKQKKPDDKDGDKIAEQFPVTERSAGKDKELYCGSCHTPHKLAFDEHDDEHEAASKKNGHRWMRGDNRDGEICQQCHESKHDNVQQKKRTTKGINHAVGYFLKAGESMFYAKDKNLHKGLPEKLEAAGAQLNSQQQMICQSCHKVHGSDEEKLTVMKTDSAQMCVQCHQRHAAKDLKDARRKGVHPVNIKLDEPVKINGREITKVDCLSCHSAHDGKPGSALLNLDDKNGELCNVCHKDYERVVSTAHDLRLSARKSENNYQQTPEQAGVCGSCHRMHQAQKNKFSLDATVTEAYQGKEKPLPRDQICLNCHRKDGIADKAQIKYFSHPSEDMILRSDKKDMPLLDDENTISAFGEIACITCHNPHRWSAHEDIEAQAIKKGWHEKDNGDVRSSFLRRKKIRDSFCQNCHGIETKIKYKYYHLELAR